MKVVMTQALCEEGMELLNDIADVYIADDPNPNNYLEEMKTADVLIVRIAECNKSVIENSPELKVIGRPGVGYDTVDVKKATELGIPVVITPGANNRSVAEHAVSMMFALSKNLLGAQDEMRKGNWEIRNAGRSFELEGKTVGIIGLGSIGQEVVKICKGIGMHVSGYDPFLSQNNIEKLGISCHDDYEALIKKADIVTIHVPLTEETQNMISKKQLFMMKKTALLINCSRGGIINERDLILALKEGRIAGAGLDVFCEEPIPVQDSLFDCPNLLMSPHSAAQTREAVVRMAQMCVAGCIAVCKGEKWPYVADPSVYAHPRWQKRG